MADRTEDETPPFARHAERTENANKLSSSGRLSTLYLSLSDLPRTLGGACLSILAQITPGATAAPATESAPASSEAVSSRHTGADESDVPSDVDFESTYTPDIDPDHPLLGVDPELLNPERRILQLLLSEGGTLRQSTLVERTRWSASTVSRSLCRMETQERVQRYRRGAGNIVILPQNREY